ncbi:hypothetical protein CEXT_723321, partial [Caerostris extrusa]
MRKLTPPGDTQKSHPQQINIAANRNSSVERPRCNGKQNKVELPKGIPMVIGSGTTVYLNRLITNTHIGQRIPHWQTPSPSCVSYIL